MVGVDQEGTPNLVEEGELIFNDYVFSNRLKPTKKILADSGFNKKYEDWTFAKIAEDLQKESSERPNDNISLNTLNDSMNRLITMQEQIRENKRTNSYKCGGKVNKFANGTPQLPTIDTDIIFEDDLILPNDNFKKLDITNNIPFLTNSGKEINANNAKYLIKDGKVVFDDRDGSYGLGFQVDELGKYAPTITNALTGVFNAIQQPDYMDYTHIDNASEYYKNIPTIAFDPVGGKQVYTPIDDNYLTNQMLADTAATRRAIQNSGVTGSQAMMHLGNIGYNAQRNLADAKLQLVRENEARKLQTAQFNLGIDQFNTQGSMQAQQVNQARAAQIAGAMGNVAQQKIAIDQYNRGLDQLKGQAVSNSIGALSEDLANIATENYWKKQIENNPAFMEYIANMNKAKASAKNGGMLTRKRRK